MRTGAKMSASAVNQSSHEALSSSMKYLKSDKSCLLYYKVWSEAVAECLIEKDGNKCKTIEAAQCIMIRSVIQSSSWFIFGTDMDECITWNFWLGSGFIWTLMIFCAQTFNSPPQNFIRLRVEKLLKQDLRPIMGRLSKTQTNEIHLKLAAF